MTPPTLSDPFWMPPGLCKSRACQTSPKYSDIDQHRQGSPLAQHAHLPYRVHVHIVKPAGGAQSLQAYRLRLSCHISQPGPHTARARFELSSLGPSAPDERGYGTLLGA